MIGRPIYFDPDIFCSVVEMLIRSDEVERAFRMLDLVPAFYRDHPTERMREIRDSLHRQLFTPAQYAEADRDADKCELSDLIKYWPGRAQALASKVKEINDTGIKPNIMEIGPGSFWLPYVLRDRGLEFTYEYQSLSKKAAIPFDPPPESGGINIFVAYELIEHLSNEMEIYQAFLKFKKEAKYIFLSTPLYTWGGGMYDWRSNALGHLRTYTPKEFMGKAQGMFMGYQWSCFADDCIILIGEK